MNRQAVRDDRTCFFVGWDVGGWNCDNNSQSRDAIVILDRTLQVVGVPWRGNLRNLINAAPTTAEWLEGLFQLCGVTVTDEAMDVTMAIDTPLGFSEEFRNLVNRFEAVHNVGNSPDNPYLYRQTERHLFRQGRRPLSPIKDMIGSQATKGMHVLAKFAPTPVSCGVWSDGNRFRAFESYPSATRDLEAIHGLRKGIPKMRHPDIEDALMCALVAHLFSARPEALEAPGPDVPVTEGWIWVPQRPPTA
jgi:hypothetical protein